MTDKREMILTQMLTILQAIPGLAGVYRDVGPLNPTGDQGAANLPAAILLDGDERPRVSTLGTSFGAVPAAAVMTLDPEVWIVLMPRINMLNDGVGEELSDFRVKVLKAVLNNESLVAMLGANGEIEYRGCTTDMKQGRTIEGQICLFFGLTYALNYAQL